jgi:two-component system OmpR family response regulator
MTVTPLTRRDHTGPYRSIRTPQRRRPTLDRSGGPADALTVSFAVTLTGEARYREALDLIDGLRQVTDGLPGVSLDVIPGTDADIDLGTGPHIERESRPAGTNTGIVAGTAGGIVIGLDSRRVLLDGEPVDLTRIEFDLLAFLAEHPQRAFTRSQLLAHVWGYAHTGERTVDVHIRRVRAKLGDRPIFTTIRGIGYRLSDGADIRLVSLR